MEEMFQEKHDSRQKINVMSENVRYTCGTTELKQKASEDKHILKM